MALLVRVTSFAPRRTLLTTRLPRLFGSSISGSPTTTNADHAFEAKSDITESQTGAYPESATETTRPIFHETPPWNNVTNTRRNNNKTRFRQHVNPLSRRYQQPTQLDAPTWPLHVYDDCTRPLHLDIGCGKGGFLMDLAELELGNEATEETSDGSHSAVAYNYLGLEIRPSVAELARNRVVQRAELLQGRVEFVGCNANVDLDRLLRLYHQNTTGRLLQRVTIQFPDPHFKKQHAKRRVVTPALVQTLAQYMPAHAQVLLQSDIQNVLDEMRLEFRANAAARCCFVDSLPTTDEYLTDNPLPVPTERETSVLKRELPVFRCLFVRTDDPYDGDGDNLPTQSDNIP